MASIDSRSIRVWPLVEWVLLALAAPLLLFKISYAPAGLALVAIAWISRRATIGRWSVYSKVHVPIVVFIFALLGSLVPSIRLDYSMPKLWGVLLGLAVLYACINTISSNAAAQLVGWALLPIGVTIAVVGVLYMADPGSKLFGQDVYRLMPSFDRRIQSSTIVASGINANQVGGALTLFVPLAFALAAGQGRRRWASAGCAVLLVSALVLTQSRASLIGVGAALLVGAAWWLSSRTGGHRGVALGVALLAVGAAIAAVRLPPSSGVFRSLLVSFEGRLELWQRALAMIVDMPFTGVGLNSFPIVVNGFYPGFVPTGYVETELLVPHAHNFYLQTAVDLGIVGLVAMGVIVALAVGSGRRAARSGPHRMLAAGLLLGLLAHGVFGLLDTVALGAKPSPILWAVVGLLLALDGTASARRPVQVGAGNPSPVRRRWGLAAGAAVSVLLVPLLITPLSLNVATMVLHKEAAAAAGSRPLVAESLNAAEVTAWGPYPARVWAARALAARIAGDGPGELAALERAVALGPWDPSLEELRDEARLLQSDTATAVGLWGQLKVVETLLRRGRVAPMPQAVDLLARAESVAPNDERPAFAAAEILAQAGRTSEAEVALARAIRRRGTDPWRTALAARLESPATALPRLPAENPAASRFYPSEGPIYGLASKLLSSRSDTIGAGYADRLSALCYLPPT